MEKVSRFFTAAFQYAIVARMVLGLILLGAALAKAHELVTGPVPSAGFWNSRGFLSGLVEWELILGLWLISGVRPRLALRTAYLTLLCFLAFNVSQILMGVRSFRCFGRSPIPSWYMVAFDLDGLVAVLLAMRRTPAAIPHQIVYRLRRGVLLMLIPLLSIPAFFAMHRPDRINLQLRNDPRLQAPLNGHANNPTLQDIFDRLKNAAGVTLTAAEPFQDRQPDFGYLSLKGIRPFALMELIALRYQWADWQPTDNGYRLGRIPLWRRLNPLLAGGLILVCEIGIISACWRPRKLGGSPASTSPAPVPSETGTDLSNKPANAQRRGN